MSTTHLMRAAMVAASLVTIPMFAAAQDTSTGTLTVTATVESSIGMTFENDAAGVALTGAGTNAATMALGAISAYNTIAGPGVTRTVSASDFTVSSPFAVKADEGSSAKADGSGAIRSEWFTIQVAESISARHARAMVDELKNAGHAAYLERAASGVNAPYRVRVGHFSMVADATRSARTLEKALGWQVSVTAISAESVVRGNTVGYVK